MKDDSAALDIFISIPFYYPEVSSIKYDSSLEQIIVNIALPESKNNLQTIEKKIMKALLYYYKNSKIKTKFIDLALKEISSVKIIKLTRDVNSFSIDEIDLFINLIREEIPGHNNSNSIQLSNKEMIKNEVKKNLLDKLNDWKKHPTHFIAYRENGRIFLFNH